MNKEVNELLSLFEVIVKLGEVERADYWPGENRGTKETDIEHSMFLAFIAWQIAHKFNLDLNQELILKYALVHDLVEAHAGDTPLFADEDQKNAGDIREAEALVRLKSELPNSDIPSLIDRYNEKADDEAKFVKAVDKLVALFSQIKATKSQFVDNKISENDINELLPRWREDVDYSEELKEFTDKLLEVWWNANEFYKS